MWLGGRMKIRSFTILLLVLLLAGCSSSGSSTDPVASLTLNPEGNSPLAALLAVSWDREFTVEVELDDGSESSVLVFDETALEHSLPVLGFKPDRSYTLRVSLHTRTGSLLRRIREPFMVTTGPLPEDMPEIELRSADSRKMEPGLTLFATALGGSYIVVVDSAGDVVWYLIPEPAFITDVRQLGGGNIMFMSNAEVMEVDMLGRTIRRFVPTLPGDPDPESGTRVDDPGGLGFHHEAYPLAGGGYLTLGEEIADVQHYHVSDTDPSVFDTVSVVSDTIVEFDEDGVVQSSVALLDILDTSRVSYESISRDPLNTNNRWTHGNAVIPAGGRDVVISSRNQNALVRLDRDTGEIKWILGTHENWSTPWDPYLLTPVGGDLEWPYHQHAPVWTPDGNLVLFDNGNHRASPYDGTMPMAFEDSYSRAVEYRVDGENMTVEQVWQYGAGLPEKLYSAFMGDADYLPVTDNVLITFGAVEGFGSVTSADMGRGKWQARIIEVSRDDADEVVFDLSVYVSAAEYAFGCYVYRAERIAGLYGE
jgi:hypothetical protein